MVSIIITVLMMWLGQSHLWLVESFTPENYLTSGRYR